MSAAITKAAPLGRRCPCARAEGRRGRRRWRVHGHVISAGRPCSARAAGTSPPRGAWGIARFDADESVGALGVDAACWVLAGGGAFALQHSKRIGGHKGMGCRERGTRNQWSAVGAAGRGAANNKRNPRAFYGVSSGGVGRAVKPRPKPVSQNARTEMLRRGGTKVFVLCWRRFGGVWQCLRARARGRPARHAGHSSCMHSRGGGRGGRPPPAAAVMKRQAARSGPPCASREQNRERSKEPKREGADHWVAQGLPGKGGKKPWWVGQVRLGQRWSEGWGRAGGRAVPPSTR